MKVFMLDDGFVAVAEPVSEGVRLSIPDLSGAHDVVQVKDGEYYDEDLVMAGNKLYAIWVDGAYKLGFYQPESIVPLGLAETQRLLGVSVSVPTESEGE
jgi:hypothetical protein